MVWVEFENQFRQMGKTAEDDDDEAPVERLKFNPGDG